MVDKLHQALRHPVLRQVALLGIAALVLPGWAGDRQHEWVPEFNAFIKFSDRTRLYLLGDITRGQSPEVTDGEVGAHLDFTLMPILRPQLQDANWARDRYLWVRAGYVVAGDLDGRSDGFSERRGVLEVTVRAVLPNGVWLVNRLRADLRDLDGQFSKRYRYRLGIEREFNVDGVVLVPYAQAETFYDTRYKPWNRQLYQPGLEI